jgi:hypothetical protein
MSITGVTSSLNSLNSPTTKSKADESLQQLAAEGDPIAIAELKQQEQQQNPASQSPASEPGKGQKVDSYV